MNPGHAKHPVADDHRLLALCAADCAEQVLPLFEELHAGDDRPRKAIAAARAWARGLLPVEEARRTAFAAHTAARAATSTAAREAARAAGHAAATAHVASHARHAAAYAVKAVIAWDSSADTSAAEKDGQHRLFPEQPRAILSPDSKQELDDLSDRA